MFGQPVIVMHRESKFGEFCKLLVVATVGYHVGKGLKEGQKAKASSDKKKTKRRNSKTA